MRNTYPVLLALCLCLGLLSGCALTSNSPKQANQAVSGSKVAILSALGDDMHSVKIATFATNHVTDRRDVSQWQINQAINKDVSALLDNDPRFTAVAARYDSNALHQSLESDSSGLTLFSDLDGSAESLRSIASDAGADLILLIRPAHVVDNQFGSDHVFAGYGLAYRSVNGVKRDAAYAALSIELRDAKTLARLAGSARNQLLLQPLDPGSYQSEAANYTRAQLQQIQSAVRRLTSDAVSEQMTARQYAGTQ